MSDFMNAPEYQPVMDSKEVVGAPETIARLEAEVEGLKAELDSVREVATDFHIPTEGMGCRLAEGLRSALATALEKASRHGEEIRKATRAAHETGVGVATQNCTGSLIRMKAERDAALAEAESLKARNENILIHHESGIAERDKLRAEVQQLRDLQKAVVESAAPPRPFAASPSEIMVPLLQFVAGLPKGGSVTFRRD